MHTETPDYDRICSKSDWDFYSTSGNGRRSSFRKRPEEQLEEIQ